MLVLPLPLPARADLRDRDRGLQGTFPVGPRRARGQTRRAAGSSASRALPGPTREWWGSGCMDAPAGSRASGRPDGSVAPTPAPAPRLQPPDPAQTHVMGRSGCPHAIATQTRVTPGPLRGHPSREQKPRCPAREHPGPEVHPPMPAVQDDTQGSPAQALLATGDPCRAPAPRPPCAPIPQPRRVHLQLRFPLSCFARATHPGSPSFYADTQPEAV